MLGAATIRPQILRPLRLHFDGCCKHRGYFVQTPIFRFSERQKAKSRKSDKDESGEAETTRNKQLDTVQGVPTSFGCNTRKRNFISFRIFLNFFNFFQTVPIHNVETVRDNLKEYERFKTESKLHFCIESA